MRERDTGVYIAGDEDTMGGGRGDSGLLVTAWLVYKIRLCGLNAWCECPEIAEQFYQKFVSECPVLEKTSSVECW